MKITNYLNLPDPLFQAAKAAGHRMAGDISVSSLIDSFQIYDLNKKYKGS